MLTDSVSALAKKSTSDIESDLESQNNLKENKKTRKRTTSMEIVGSKCDIVNCDCTLYFSNTTLPQFANVLCEKCNHSYINHTKLSHEISTIITPTTTTKNLSSSIKETVKEELKTNFVLLTFYIYNLNFLKDFMVNR